MHCTSRTYVYSCSFFYYDVINLICYNVCVLCLVWYSMCILTMLRLRLDDVFMLCDLINLMRVTYDLWFSYSFKEWCSRVHKTCFKLNVPFKAYFNGFMHGLYTLCFCANLFSIFLQSVGFGEVIGR